VVTPRLMRSETKTKETNREGRMKLNNETLKIVFDYIDNQLNDDHGEYDNETDLLVAVKSAINHIEESDQDIEED
jgi:hypothetical protein